MLQKWFNGINEGQRWIIRIAVGLLIWLSILAQSELLFLLFLILGIILIYLEFGRKKKR